MQGRWGEQTLRNVLETAGLTSRFDFEEQVSLDTDEAFDTPYTRRDNPHRAYITIIEGCDKFCAYCVVPLVRGRELSRPSAELVAEVERLAVAAQNARAKKKARP